jgi:hypothetical protein
MRHLRKFNESLDFDPEVLAWTKDNLDMIPVDDKQYKIKIDSDLAEDIHNGIIQMSSCFVDK